jgi:hypothetical protein
VINAGNPVVWACAKKLECYLNKFEKCRFDHAVTA